MYANFLSYSTSFFIKQLTPFVLCTTSYIVDLFQAVIYEACCSMATNRVQAAQYLMKQLFDDYECDSYSVPDKQQLESMHNDGRIKLNQILASSNELRLSNLSVERLSSQKNHKAMCRILEGFFKGIDDVLPPPTIIQVHIYSNVFGCCSKIIFVDYSRLSRAEICAGN